MHLSQVLSRDEGALGVLQLAAALDPCRDSSQLSRNRKGGGKPQHSEGLRREKMTFLFYVGLRPTVAGSRSES